MKELLRVSHLATRDIGGASLQDLCMTVFAGEIVFFTGVHGSGKHALPLVLNGKLPADGHVYIEEQEISNPGTYSLEKMGIVCVDHTKSIVNSLTISENLFVLRPWKRNRLLYKRNIEIETEHILAAYNLYCNPQDRIQNVGHLEQYLFCIAKAILWGAKLLILDCLEFSFNEEEFEKLCSEMIRLKKKGYSFLVIDNAPNPLLSISERAIVVYEGRDLKTFYDPRYCVEELKACLAGTLRKEPSRHAVNVTSEEKSDGFYLTGNTFTDCHVPKGSILGIYEKHYPKDLMFERFIGEVINKNGLRLRNDRENMPTDWRRAAFLPEKAEECLLPNLSIGENLLLPSYPHIGIPVIHRDIEKFVTNSFLEKLGYLGSSVQIENLDRRECKLLCIERWKLAKAAALVMENPEFGIDLQAQDQIFAALKSVSFSGIPVIITSYKIDALCNRCFAVLVTEHGYCKEILRGNNSARPEMWL